MRLLIISAYAPIGFRGTATYARDLAAGYGAAEPRSPYYGQPGHVQVSPLPLERASKIEVPREHNGIFPYPIRSALGKIPPDQYANRSLEAVAILVVEANKKALQKC